MQLFILLSALLLQGTPQQAVQQRSILLFGNKAEPLIKQQLQLLQQDSSGMAERDIKIVMVEPGESLYKTHAISTMHRFTVLLVGRDGHEKYRSNELTTTTHFFAMIDAMPMRRAEIRKNKNNHR